MGASNIHHDFKFPALCRWSIRGDVPNMRVYLSYQHLPELARFTPRQRKIIWPNFVEERIDAGSSHRSSQFLGVAVVLGFLSGTLIGAFNCNSPEVGVLVGGMAGCSLTLFAMHLWLLHTLRRPLRRYIASDTFSLLPISKRTRIFLDPWKRHDT
jgi:hypothetical protein